MQQYSVGITEANQKKQNHFRDILPMQLSLIQKEDEELRIAFMKAAMKKYHEIVSSVQPGISESIDFIGTILDTITPSTDSEVLANSLNTNESFPSDIQMFETVVRLCFCFDLI